MQAAARTTSPVTFAAASKPRLSEHPLLSEGPVYIGCWLRFFGSFTCRVLMMSSVAVHRAETVEAWSKLRRARDGLQHCVVLHYDTGRTPNACSGTGYLGLGALCFFSGVLDSRASGSPVCCTGCEQHSGDKVRPGLQNLHCRVVWRKWLLRSSLPKDLGGHVAAGPPSIWALQDFRFLKACMKLGSAQLTNSDPELIASTYHLLRRCNDHLCPRLHQN